MTEAERRLRALTPAQLADEVGELKAQIADHREMEEAVKAELIRRKLLAADGALFHVSLTPPATQDRFSAKALLEDKGQKFVDRYKRPVEIGWVMNCHPRKRDPKKG